MTLLLLLLLLLLTRNETVVIVLARFGSYSSRQPSPSSGTEMTGLSYHLLDNLQRLMITA